jgi:hypothetical protein
VVFLRVTLPLGVKFLMWRKGMFKDPKQTILYNYKPTSLIQFFCIHQSSLILDFSATKKVIGHKTSFL